MPTLTRIDFDVVQRSRDNCAVKMLAYDLAARMTKHDGTQYNFSRKKSELVFSEVMLPGGAPESLKDPETLANAAELAGKRRDSQTARLLLVTCPRECPEHLRIELARAIAQPYVDAGMAVVAAYHNPKASDGSEQPHFHFWITKQAVTSEGLAAKLRPDWDRQFREKLPASEDDPKPKNGSAERQRICDRANTFFARHDLQIRLDPRRLEQQGIDREPEPEAPRRAWESFKRTGYDEDAAPEPIKAVLHHRKSVRDLKKVREFQVRAQAYIDAQEAQSLANQKPKLSASPSSFSKRSEASTQMQERPIMASQPKLKPSSDSQNRKPDPKRAASHQKAAPKKTPPRKEPQSEFQSWMRYSGGYDALPPQMQKRAKESWELWRKRNPGHDSFGLDSYVSFVQQKVAERGWQEDKPEDDNTNSVRPRSRKEAEQSRLTYLEKLLAERYAVPDALREHVARLDLNRDNGHATLKLKSGGRLLDTGSEIQSLDAAINDELARATVAAAYARGWSELRVNGSPEYKAAIHRAALLYEPPLSTDVQPSKKLSREIEEALVERAKARATETPEAKLEAASINGVAPGEKPAPVPVNGVSQAEKRAPEHQPSDTAKPEMSDHEYAFRSIWRHRAQAKAELAGEPAPPPTSRESLSSPRIEDVNGKIDDAVRAHSLFKKAFDEFSAENGRLKRLTDAGVRRRYEALRVESERLQGVAQTLVNGRSDAFRQVIDEADEQFESMTRAHKAWTEQPKVQDARRTLDDLKTLEYAVDNHDTKVIALLSAGKLADARLEIPRIETEALQERLADERAVRATRTPEQVRMGALGNALRLADTAKALDDMEGLEAAQMAADAVRAGDKATIAALDGGTPLEGGLMALGDAWATRAEEWNNRRLEADKARLEEQRRQKMAEAVRATLEAQKNGWTPPTPMD